MITMQKIRNAMLGYSNEPEDNYYDDETIEEEELEYEEAEPLIRRTASTAPKISPKYFSRSSGLNQTHQPQVVNIKPVEQPQIIICNPESIEDGEIICEHIKAGKIVLVNTEDLEKDIARRIIDFMCGVICAFDGDIQIVSESQRIFVLAPHSVEITGRFKEELKTGGFSFFGRK